MIQLMTRDPQMLDADVYAMDVVKVFREKRIPSIFVCRSMKPTGILHLHDLLQKGLL
jgi:arabinose-5-phosphate isomerase